MGDGTFAVRHLKAPPPGVGDFVELVPVSSDSSIMRGRVRETSELTKTYSAVYMT